MMMAASAPPGIGSVLKDDAAAPGSSRHVVQSCALPDPRMEEKHDITQPNARSNSKYTLPSKIIAKESGTTEIIVVGTAPIHRAPYFYRGQVRFGEVESGFRDATVLAFDVDESDMVLRLHRRLNLFNHPSIMSSLGYGYGSGEQDGYIFLAFTHFESTLSDFMDKSCKNTVDLERFTEAFIGCIRCVVYGLLELHENGYYCPHLSGETIIILNEQGLMCAKLWEICALELGKREWKKYGLGEVGTYS